MARSGTVDRCQEVIRDTYPDTEEVRSGGDSVRVFPGNSLTQIERQA
jgi:hypothetical protein